MRLTIKLKLGFAFAALTTLSTLTAGFGILRSVFPMALILDVAQLVNFGQAHEDRLKAAG